MQTIETAAKARAREEKQQLISASFGSWQIIEVLKGLTSDDAKPTKFGDYLQKIGLSLDEIPKPEETIEQLRERALSTAEQIKALDQQQQEGGG